MYLAYNVNAMIRFKLYFKIAYYTHYLSILTFFLINCLCLHYEQLLCINITSYVCVLFVKLVADGHFLSFQSFMDGAPKHIRNCFLANVRKLAQNIFGAWPKI